MPSRWQGGVMAKTGGGGSRRWEVNRELDGYFWACSCGMSSGAVYTTDSNTAIGKTTPISR